MPSTTNKPLKKEHNNVSRTPYDPFCLVTGPNDADDILAAHCRRIQIIRA